MGLLEREEALAALVECRGVGGRVVLVAGEAGIGKTALVAEFAEHVDDGLLRGGCDALRTPRPLGPVRDIARAAGGRLARVMVAESVRHDRFAAFVLAHAPAAAARAAAAGAARQAADHYARALRFAGDLPPRELAELLERHETACAMVDVNAAAMESSRRAQETWEALGETGRAASALARRSNYLWRSGRTDAAYASVREAVALLDPDAPGEALAVVLTWQAYLLMFERDLPGAVEVGNRAIALAERIGDRSLLSCALNVVGSAERLATPDGPETTLLRSLEVAREAGDNVSAAGAMVNLGAAAGELRRYEIAEYWLRECITWCERRDLDGYHQYALAWLGRVLFERGRWTEAADLLGAGPPIRAAISRIVALTVLGRIGVRRGEPAGTALLDEAWELAVPTRNLQRLWPVAAGRAEAAHLAGRTDQIPSLVAGTHALAVRFGQRWAIAELGHWLHRAGGEAPGGDTPYALEAGPATGRAPYARGTPSAARTRRPSRSPRVRTRPTC